MLNKYVLQASSLCTYGRATNLMQPAAVIHNFMCIARLHKYLLLFPNILTSSLILQICKAERGNAQSVSLLA